MTTVADHPCPPYAEWAERAGCEAEQALHRAFLDMWGVAMVDDLNSPSPQVARWFHRSWQGTFRNFYARMWAEGKIR